MAENIRQRLRLINGVGIGVALTMLAGTAAFGVLPLWQAGKRNIEQAAGLTTQLRELDSLNLKLARAEVEKSSRETRLAEVEARLPDSSGINQFVQELAKAAEEAGLQIDRVMPAKEFKDAGAYKTETVSITATGDWDTCYRFLTGLRGVNRKLTRLDNLSLEAVKDRLADRPTCRLTVDITTYIAR